MHTKSSTRSTLSAHTLSHLLHPSHSHFHDVTLIPARTPGKTLSSHRFILAAISPVLRATLTADPTTPILTLAHADYDALSTILRFVYHGPPSISSLSPPLLWNTLTLCVAYAVLAPVEPVQQAIAHAVTPANVFYNWAMADKYNVALVQLVCRSVVKTHFLTVVHRPEFLSLCPKNMARLLRIHDLVVPHEHHVFHALERWLAYDVDARAENALHLLRLVRLPTISDKLLLRVCRSPYFGGHNEFYQLLLEALIRRTEVRIVHHPKFKAVQTSHSARNLLFKPIGVTETELVITPKSPQHPTSSHPPTSTDLNRTENRTVLFQGAFPLRWYKSVRFRPRSSTGLLFTVVIPRWSTCRRRFISESRSFLNHKWSLWIDPYSTQTTRSTSETSPTEPKRNKSLYEDMEGNTLATANISSAQAYSASKRFEKGKGDNDYISMYLCCESEVTGSHSVDARVDFALFVVSATEEYGMERKVCIGRTFKTHGQAMGFRRHIRRSKLLWSEANLYSREKDELVVGAHLVAPDVVQEGSDSGERGGSAGVEMKGDGGGGVASPGRQTVEGSEVSATETRQSGYRKKSVD